MDDSRYSDSRDHDTYAGGGDNEEIYSKRIKAGKRTYFLDVKATRGNDYYLTITESKRKQGNQYIRHKIFLYKEDFNKFQEGLEEVINHVKTELMPDYDYDKFNDNGEDEEAEREY